MSVVYCFKSIPPLFYAHSFWLCLDADAGVWMVSAPPAEPQWAHQISRAGEDVKHFWDILWEDTTLHKDYFTVTALRPHHIWDIIAQEKDQSCVTYCIQWHKTEKYTRPEALPLCWFTLEFTVQATLLQSLLGKFNASS